MGISILTWTIYHMGTKRYSVVRKRPPNIQFGCVEVRSWISFDGEVVVNAIVGPWYRVTTNAPVTDTIVPTTFALLVALLNTTVSILQSTTNYSKAKLQIKSL